MLNKLTEEQVEKIKAIKQEWLDYFFSCKNSINKESATIGIDWLYKISKLDKPVIIYLDSPLGCQYGVAYLKTFLKQVGQQVEQQVWQQVWQQVRQQVWQQVGQQVRQQVWQQVEQQVWQQVGQQVEQQVWQQVEQQVWQQVGQQVRQQVWQQVEQQVRQQVGQQVGQQVWQQVGQQVWQLESFSGRGAAWDSGWMSFYDFFISLGIIKEPLYNKYKDLLRSGIYDMIQLNGFCIVSNLPDIIKRDNQLRLHNSEGSAIHFRDGYEQFFWHGVAVSEKWILNSESITAEEIKSETNAEKRRVLREILGGKKYYEMAYGKDGLRLVDEDNDNQGNPMKLYETKNEDEIIKKKVQFIEVVCPSTLRVYNIYPPNQKSKNVWDAKASTFGKTRKEFQPVIES